MHADLPETCIRGPELSDPAALRATIGAADSAALAAYQQGIELLTTAHAYLAIDKRLAELRQTRAFLLGQLRTLERHDPQAFARALDAYDAQRQASNDHDATER
jgi:hypothetical protein